MYGKGSESMINKIIKFPTIANEIMINLLDCTFRVYLVNLT